MGRDPESRAYGRSQQIVNGLSEMVERYAADAAAHQFDWRRAQHGARQRDASAAGRSDLDDADRDLGLVERRGNASDRRVREAVITPRGKAMTDRVDAARERIGRAILATWDAQEIDDLVRLMRKFADAMKDDNTSSGGA